jgi:hypothetical protein
MLDLLILTRIMMRTELNLTLKEIEEWKRKEFYDSSVWLGLLPN